MRKAEAAAPAALRSLIRWLTNAARARNEAVIGAARSSSAFAGLTPDRAATRVGRGERP